jgi:ribosomal-protein-alanine N-acetyltransferase
MEPFSAADQNFVFKGLSHPDVIRFYGVSYDSFEAAAAQIEFYNVLEICETGSWWKIIDVSTGKPCGACGCNNFNPHHEKIEIGYWLLPGYQGRGIMQECLETMLTYISGRWKVHRIEAWVEAGNEASRKLLQKCGFSEEGLLRDTEVKNGKRISLYVYAKILD